MTLSVDTVWPGVGMVRTAQHDPDLAVETPEHRGVIEIEEGSMSASNSRDLTCHTGDDFDWRLHVGLIRTTISGTMLAGSCSVEARCGHHRGDAFADLGPAGAIGADVVRCGASSHRH